MERRLAAKFAADVASYIGLIELDETGTLRRLTALCQRVLVPKRPRIGELARDAEPRSGAGSPEPGAGR